jgi:hypothetical protein
MNTFTLLLRTLLLGACLFGLALPAHGQATPATPEETARCQSAIDVCKQVHPTNVECKALHECKAECRAGKKVCKREVREVKHDCKAEARTEREACLDRCPTKGKAERECKKDCRERFSDEKKDCREITREEKEVCRDDKHECVRECRHLRTPQCEDARKLNVERIGRCARALGICGKGLYDHLKGPAAKADADAVGRAQAAEEAEER